MGEEGGSHLGLAKRVGWRFLKIQARDILPPLTLHTRDSSQRRMSMYAVRNVAGKGLGLFATQRIPRGQRILTDNALLSITGSNGDILRSAYQLSQQARQILLGLSSNATKHSSLLRWLESIWLSRWEPRSLRTNHSIINIFRNNNFDIGNSVRAIFPAAARINHACVPNSQGNYNHSLNAFTIHAVHDVLPDEEITVSYLWDQLGLRDWRQNTLLERYGFACSCNTCGEEAALRQAREERRVALRQKLSVLAETAATSGEIKSTDELAMMTTMLEVYEEEGIRGREASSL